MRAGEAKCDSAVGAGQAFRPELWRKNWSALERIVLICGRYEGVDERVGQYLADRELSIGDYVLSGGELGAAVIVDAVTRLIPGAVGNEASTRQESFTGRLKDAGRDGPIPLAHRADCWTIRTTRGRRTFADGGCPEVLVSGNHEEIRRWRRRTALEKTLRNRPDLLDPDALERRRQEIAGPNHGQRN